MDERIVRFISALRSSGVRISLAESADAFGAVQEMGVRDREHFRISLRSTLVKDFDDLPTFEELFPLFFDTAEIPPLFNLNSDLTPEEAQMLAQALKEFNEKLRQMLERLLRGEKLSPEELDRLSRFVGLDQAKDLRYREWMSQKMQRALNFKEVREAIEELAELLGKMGMNRERAEQIRQLLQANQQALAAQLDQQSGEKIAENMSEQQPDRNGNSLLQRPFDALSDKDLFTLRREVQRLAAALRTRVALRQKRAKSGALDAKATIRANLKNGSVPIEIRHKDRSLKPKLVAMCDISTSMRYCSELMLSLLYAMHDQISKTHAFAFIDHLEYVSPDFTHTASQKAVEQVLMRMPSGHYNTDLGYSLEQFNQDFLDMVDSRTIFIVVGDGRNNYNDPRLDLFNKITRRCRRTIWLTPEPPGLWGTGDSDMLKYAAECDTVLQVSNMADLAAAVDKLLTQG
ncbi:MAG: VWA domain-containing protein [Methanothrix sp.]|nr:VWA domain-containing protein [Methanothrix sp.]